jgi:hypothetical protein
MAGRNNRDLRESYGWTQHAEGLFKRGAAHMSSPAEQDNQASPGERAGDHLPYGVLRRYAIGEDPGGGCSNADVQRHFENCRVCEEKFRFVLGTYDSLWERSEQQWQEWQGVLRQEAEIRSQADQAYRAHALRAQELRKQLAMASSERDQTRREELERKTFSAVGNPYFLRAVDLIQNKDLVGLNDLSSEIAGIPNADEREKSSVALAAACELARGQSVNREASEVAGNWLTTPSEEVAIPYRAGHANDKKTTEETEVAALVVLKVFSVAETHTRAGLDVLSFEDNRIRIRLRRYQELCRSRRKRHPLPSPHRHHLREEI